jgi:pimeloyl-ACP methyl ester carboxylesterase
MRSRFVDLDGPVHVADFGGRGTPIVLVHGLGGSHANWLAVGERLAERGRVLAPDLAGFGRTPLAGRSSGVGANRALLDRFLGASCEEPAVLVGNSMGGLIALMEAALRPEKVAALVLVGPAQPRPILASADWTVVATFAAYALPMVGETFVRWRARLLGPEGLVRQTLALCCVDASRVPPDVFAAHVALAEERAAGMPWAAEAFLGAARSVVARTIRAGWFADLVRAVKAPTLLLQGDCDRLVPLAASRAVAQSRPDWRLEVLPGIGHVPQLEAPERFVDVVGAWLDEVRVPSGEIRDRA